MTLTCKRRILTVALMLPALAAAELSISGIDDELEKNVRVFVGLASEPCDAEDWRVRRRFGTIEKEARRALEPFGYYDPVISASLTFEDRCWRATLDVTPGEQIVLRDVAIGVIGDAADDTEFETLIRTSQLKPGAALQHLEYDQIKKRLQTLAADRGYIEAEFTESKT